MAAADPSVDPSAVAVASAAVEAAAASAAVVACWLLHRPAAVAQLQQLVAAACGWPQLVLGLQ